MPLDKTLDWLSRSCLRDLQWNSSSVIRNVSDTTQIAAGLAISFLVKQGQISLANFEEFSAGYSKETLVLVCALLHRRAALFTVSLAVPSPCRRSAERPDSGGQA